MSVIESTAGTSDRTEGVRAAGQSRSDGCLAREARTLHAHGRDSVETARPPPATRRAPASAQSRAVATAVGRERVRWWPCSAMRNVVARSCRSSRSATYSSSTSRCEPAGAWRCRYGASRAQAVQSAAAASDAQSVSQHKRQQPGGSINDIERRESHRAAAVARGRGRRAQLASSASAWTWSVT